MYETKDPKLLLLRALGIVEKEIKHLEEESKDKALSSERANSLCAYSRVLSQMVGKDLTPDDTLTAVPIDELNKLLEEAKRNAANAERHA